jgi:3-hydroxyethyl bacteriochlorophyllide a dehydrogenase
VETLAVVFEEPGHLTLRPLHLVPMAPDDVRVAMRWSGISTGTEKLLYTGQMPPFPGLGYPLVPGYEGVGEVVEAGPEAGRRVGDLVYVPGSRGFVGARGLFGGQAATVVAPGAKVIPLEASVGEQGTLLALAATAHHMLGPDPASHPERLPGLIVGHGALGRLLARLVLLYGGAPPVVWEVNPDRLGGATGYEVLHPDADTQRGYRTIAEVSGADGIVDACVARLAPGGEVVLGGFYAEPVRITFPPAFLREARFRVAAQWHPADLAAVARHANEGRLPLDGLITHRAPAVRAPDAYATAFGDAQCVKMILDWRSAA